MFLTKSRHHNRRKHAARQRKMKQYLIDREKEPMFPIPENLANALGDIAPREWITQREYVRCLARLEDIRAGLIKRSTRNERLGISKCQT
jgi:hypothetical protein